MIPKQLQNLDFRFLLLCKKEKMPIAKMTGWQKDNFEWDNPFLQNHLEQGGNYGIIGGYGNLILIDSDSKEITDIAESLKETFTIKTGSPEEYKKHYFFIVNQKMKPIRLSKEKVGDLGDVRSVGQYVVAPNSIHPSGNQYKVIKDIQIAHITESEIRLAFREYIDKTDSTEFKEYPIETKLRSTKYIRECRMPDFLLNNKVKGETSKNWKLFRFVVDILHNRETAQGVYQNLARKQGHSEGAIKGWYIKAKEGKLGKSSCKLMRDYIDRYHPELKESICGDCPLYQNIKKIQEIKESSNTELQKDVLTYIAVKDRNNATELITQEIKKNNFIYSTRDDIKSEMWLYDEGVYRPNGKSFVREFCRKILHHAYTPHLANEVISKIEADTFIEQEEFFENKNIEEIPVINGILNVVTEELSDFDPKKIFFNKLPVEYDPEKECPDIEKFLKDILTSEEDIDVAYELIGSGLFKEYFTEKAGMLVGKGRNGKGKFMELIKRFVGVKNCCSVPLRSMREDNSSLCELHGRLFNLAGDLSAGDLKDTGCFKQTVGRDLISAHRKFLRDLIFQNYAKHIFACNELPRVYDTTDGFWDKWVLLEFPYKFISQKEMDVLEIDDRANMKLKDPHIIDKITNPGELSGLLNHSIKGLKRLFKIKNFSQTKGTKEIKDFWIRNSDSFASFCIDCIEEDYNSYVSKKDLRKKYHTYCKQHKVKGTGDKSIKATLEDRYGVVDGRKAILNEYIHVWEGIKFK